MKKIYSLIALFVLPLTLVAQSDYCTLSGYTSRADNRGISSLTVSDGQSSVSVAGPGVGNRQALYLDQTAVVLTTQPGATITVKNNGSGGWMHSYLYVDYDKNGTFEVNEANCRGAKLDGELVSHTGYSGLQTTSYNKPSDPTVYSDGTPIDYGISYSLTMPSFTIPADLAPGNYRIRHKVDWNCVDPCGRTAENGYYNDFIGDNGGGIIDFTICIESSDYETARTITVASANAAQGSVAITNPATDGNSVSTTQKSVTMVATPAEGYSFLNWTDAEGNVVSTDASYTYTGAEDASFTAHFGFALTYSVGANGSATFSVGTEMLASGAVVAPGTEVVMTANPDTNKFTTMTINGESVSVVGNTHTFVVEEATDVVVNFVDAIYTMTINIIGDGEVKITDNGTHKTGPTGNEYVSGSEITGKALRGFFKPAEGAQLVYVGYIDEGLAEEDKTENLRAVEAAGYEGWYYVPLNRPAGNRVLTVKFTEVSAIGEIGVDPANGPVEYYNLQGVRVAAENLVPGFYVVRQGDKVAKVFINK